MKDTDIILIEYRKYLISKLPAFKSKLSIGVKKMFFSSPYYSLFFRSGPDSLKGHLGLEDPKSSVDPIIEAVISSLEVNINPKNILEISLVANKEELINLPTSSYISDSSRRKIKWLDWMFGNVQTIRAEISFDLSGIEKQRSRSKDALMFFTDNNQIYDFPQKYQNNFIYKMMQDPILPDVIAEAGKETYG